MSNRSHALAQLLTGKATIEECSEEELRHHVKRHPYFAPAQFLLLQKLRQLQSSEGQEQNKKSILFYHDPLLFDHFISSDRFYVDEEKIFQNNDPSSTINESAAPLTDASPLILNEDLRENMQRPSWVEPEGKKEDQEISGIDKDPEVEKPDQEKNLAEQVHSTTIEIPKEDVSSSPTQNLPFHSIKEATPSDAKEELTFEPYHTVDYFASQGIKISADELPKDKLGKQLKSFTEWLKTMKRLPATPVTAGVEPLAEKKIETMAGDSVTDSHVVTEAMADVWVKQGNNEKAIDIYNKLSLLNPSKTAYFAAKIDNLKQP